MATIYHQSMIKPLTCDEEEKERWENKTQRFIGLEIETTRNLQVLPKQEDLKWHDSAYSMNDPEKKRLGEILDPSQKMIAMIGPDGDDIEVITQPMSKKILMSRTPISFFNNINRFCCNCFSSLFCSCFCCCCLLCVHIILP